MKGVKKYYQNKLIEDVKQNPKLADDCTIDHTKIFDIIVLSLTLRTLRLILMIWNFSFFIGMGWLLLCVSLEEYKLQKNYLDIMGHDHEALEPDFTFIDDYQLSFQTAYE
jgi:hypothetical protein